MTGENLVLNFKDQGSVRNESETSQNLCITRMPGNSEINPLAMSWGSLIYTGLFGKFRGCHGFALLRFLMKDCLMHSFLCQDMNSKADKGQAKGGKAQQNSAGDKDGGSAKKDFNKKKADFKQEKDPTTTVVNWALPTHFRPEPVGETSVIDSQACMRQDDLIDKDALALELVASQSHGVLITDTIMISIIVIDGINAFGRPRIGQDQLNYLIAGALAPYGFQVTAEGLQEAWSKLCVTSFMTGG